ncbi:MAG TPA: ABC transporter permease, partial [Clostridia bacterium]
SLIVPENAGEMTHFVNLRVRETNEPVPLGDDGVVLTEKLAVMLGVRTGGEIQLKIGDSPAVSAKVSGITENYLRHFIYMSPGLYIKLVHSAPVFNQTVVRLNDVNTETQQEFAQNIVSLSGASAVVLTSDSYAMFNDMVQSIYSIVLILILSAALLSFIVLFSLTNININERMREIATIKILGFYDKEVSSYIFRESLILTAIGTAFGLALGDPLARYVIGSAEVEMVMFGRRIFPLSFLIAAALTLVFAFSVNLVMIRRLKKIQMIEALKSVE